MNSHEPGTQKKYRETKENNLRYLLYLPAKFNASAKKRWPILCCLHGAGEAAKDKNGRSQKIEVLMNHGSPSWHCEIDSPLIQDFIVLSPQLPARGQWRLPDFDNVIKILETVYTNFRGDPDRTYLTGFSYGAKAVFDFSVWAKQPSNNDPSRKVSWAALWPVDDANDQARPSCSVKRIWLHFGTWKPDPQRKTANNLKLNEVKAFRGSHPKTDGYFTDYTPFNYDHTTTCAVSYADWRVYEWLLSL